LEREVLALWFDDRSAKTVAAYAGSGEELPQTSGVSGAVEWGKMARMGGGSEVW
jgi:hypothetical protein